MEDYQICWRGYVHDSTGYSRAGREYVLALDNLGLDVKIEPLSYPDNVNISVVMDEDKSKKIEELINKPYSENKKRILIYHSQPFGINPDEEREKGYDYVIINTVWETDKIPKNWISSSNKADAIFVPSSQNIVALSSSGVTTNKYIVPHGADTDFFRPDNDKLRLQDAEGKFVFLSVFQWQHRKAPEVLLNAFWEEFSPNDNVCLIVKTYWGNVVSKLQQRTLVSTISNYKHTMGFSKDNTAPVYVTTSIFSDEDIKGLYSLSDCFVLPTRGEGVGLPFIESLSSGKPVIATGWGGQTDFLNEDNSYLVDYELLPTTSKIGQGIAPSFHSLFTSDMNWAEPSVESLRKQMRHVYDNQDEAKEKSIRGRRDMEEMSWEKSAITMREFIKKVVDKK